MLAEIPMVAWIYMFFAATLATVVVGLILGGWLYAMARLSDKEDKDAVSREPDVHRSHRGDSSRRDGNGPLDRQVDRETEEEGHGG